MGRNLKHRVSAIPIHFLDTQAAMPSTENGKYTNSNATPMVDIDRNKSHRFKAIIVGGSVTGLVLALSLQHVGIDFVVLEARDRIDPQAGASIGISSNGARILDQLGVYEDIERRTEPPIWHELVTGRGKLLQKSDSLQLIQARYASISYSTLMARNSDYIESLGLIEYIEYSMGYAITFLERRLALKLLLDHIQNKNQILTNKKAIYVDHHTDGVIVHCNDGSQFSGDIVVAADGAHSSIRREMWLHVDRCIGPLKMAEDERGTRSQRPG